jgi:hypothetical protein
VREKLNSNPIAQVAVVAVLVVAAAYLLLSSGGGESGSSSASGTTEATVSVAGSGVTGTATAATPGAAVEGAVAAAGSESSVPSSSSALPTSIPSRPPPAPVTDAYKAGKTVVLLVVHDGGIDDRIVAHSTSVLSGMPDVALFVVPARRIARYSAITFGVDVQQVPALIVMRPRRLSGHTPQASVSYGFQTKQTIAQAVRNASYDGPEVTYHPN